MYKKQGCIFDFDDTLVEATIYFDRAKERFAGKMKEFGFPVEESLKVLNQFDISNVIRCGGFHKQCFPDALVQTFEHYCQLHNCIHVYHRNTWDFEEEQAIGEFYSIREISEVPAVIKAFQNQFARN